MDFQGEVPVLRYMSSIEMPRALEREDSVLPQGGKLYRVLAVAAEESHLRGVGLNEGYERGTAVKYPEQPGKSQLAVYYKCPEWVVPLPQTLHVLLIILKSPDEIEKISALGQAHAYCSQKYVSGPQEEEILTFAREIGAVFKSLEDVSPLHRLHTLIEDEENHIMELVGNVFTEFDKDKSGFIDVHEIEAMASQLGTSVTAEEIRVIMEEVDTDKDGRISKDEFSRWWLKGRKGKAKIMRDLTSTVTKAKGFLQKYGPDVRRMMGGTDIQSKERSNFRVRLSSGEIEHPGLQAKLHLSLGDSETLKTLAQSTEIRDIMFIVALKINDGVDAAALRSKVEGFVQQGLRILADCGREAAELVNETYVKVSLVDDKLVLGVLSQEGPLLETVAREYSHFKRLITACDFEQTIDLSIKMEASPESMSDNEDRLLIEHFLDGLEISAEVSIWRFYRELLAWGMKKYLKGHEQFLFLLTLLGEGEIDLSLDNFDLLPSSVVSSLRKLINRRAPFLLIKNLKNAKKMSAGFSSLPLILSVNETLLECCSSAKVDVFGKFFDVAWTGSVCLPSLSSLIRF